MAIKSKRDDEIQDKQVKKVVKEVLASSKPLLYNTIKLVNLISACVKLDGPVTGNKYVWSKAGAIVAVDEKDATELLKKKLGEKICCGNSGANMLFSISN